MFLIKVKAFRVLDAFKVSAFFCKKEVHRPLGVRCVGVNFPLPYPALENSSRSYVVILNTFLAMLKSKMWSILSIPLGLGVLDALGSLLGPCWVLLKRSWGALGVSGGSLGALLGALGALWRRSWDALGRSWVALGRS